MLLEELEKRVVKLEKEFATMKQSIAPAPAGKDWRSTFGMFADDLGFDEVLRLGREIREQDSVEEDNHAGA